MNKSLVLAAAFAVVALPALAQINPMQPSGQPTPAPVTTATPGSPPAVANPAMNMGRPPMMTDKMRARLEQLTPAQREEMKKRAEARMAKWNAMTPEEQSKMSGNMAEQRKQWEALDPEQRATMEKAGKEQYEKFQAMSPEQREAMKKEMDDRRAAFEKLSPEQKQKLIDAARNGAPQPGTNRMPGQPPMGGQPGQPAAPQGGAQ